MAATVTVRNVTTIDSKELTHNFWEGQIEGLQVGSNSGRASNAIVGNLFDKFPSYRLRLSNTHFGPTSCSMDSSYLPEVMILECY